MSKGGGKTQTTTQTSTPWAEQQPFLKDLFSRANTMFQNQSAPGSLTGQAQQQIGQTIGGDFLRQDSNPYLRGAVNEAMNDVQGRVSGMFGSRGGNNFGSSAHQEWLGKALAGAALPVYAQNYQAERDRQLQGAQMGPGAAWSPLQQFQGAVGGNYGGTSQTQQPLHGGNPAADALGLGIGGVGLWNMMGGAPLLGGAAGGAGLASFAPFLFSDRRKKRDIKRVGTHRSGLPLYSFRYLYDDTPRLGVMADEVEKVMPQAVSRDANGIAMVNYSMLEQ